VVLHPQFLILTFVKMKKHFFIILVFAVALVGKSSAQETQTRPKWLFKAGGISANQTMDFFDSPPTSGGGRTTLLPKWGLHVGAFREWPLGKHLSLVAGLSYRQRGARQTPEQATFLAGTEITTLHYVSGDMLFKYTFQIGKISPYLLGGARLDHFLARNGTDYFNGLYGGQQPRQLDAGPVVGIGLQMPVGKHFVGLEVEYNPGVGAVVNRSLFGAQFFNRSRAVTLVWGF
jgi:hypothetical protein